MLHQEERPQPDDVITPEEAIKDHSVGRKGNRRPDGMTANRSIALLAA
jgi:hypothetical protein